LGAGGAGAGGAGLLGAGLGSEASGTDGDRGLAAVASIFVMTMNAVALTAKQAVVRMMAFNMASSPSRRGSIRRCPALRKGRATGHDHRARRASSAACSTCDDP
jgi:hypothetical protein